MKKILYLAGALLLGACTQNPESTGITIKSVDFQDSTAYSYVTMHAELPQPDNAVSTAIYDTLVAVIDNQLAHSGIEQEDDSRLMAPYQGDHQDLQALIDYYGKALSHSYSKEAAEENRMCEGEDIVPWNYDMQLTVELDTTDYIVFNSMDYVYLGGAHGGITGRGSMTFRKSDGCYITNFFLPNVVEKMQPLIRKGVIQYFSEYGEKMTEDEIMDELMLPEGNDNIIPLPTMAPYPGPNGLVLTYYQYEIACYAAGMINFVIPYQDVKPYLTDEVKELLKLK